MSERSDAMHVVTPSNMPVLELGSVDGSSDAALSGLVAETRRSLEDFNFVAFRDARMSAELIAEVMDLGRQFFEQAAGVKRRFMHRHGTGAAGYMPYGSEKGLKGEFPDMKEFWHTRQELPRFSLSRLRWLPYYQKNIWPDEVVSGFRPKVEALFRHFAAASDAMLQLMALSIGVPRRYLADPVVEGPHTFRLLRYPPLPDGLREGEVRSVEHTGAGVFGLLPPATDPGLEIINRRGEWQRLADFTGNTVVITVADMMELLTNFHIRSSPHRVFNPVGEAARRSRYAMVFFAVARPGVLLDCPSRLLGAGESRGFEPIRAGQFLANRMNQVTVKASAAGPRRDDMSQTL
jgi:isopenicillin N synthase-like dioxygenase